MTKTLISFGSERGLARQIGDAFAYASCQRGCGHGIHTA